MPYKIKPITLYIRKEYLSNMIKATFELEKETKGTYRYKELSDTPVIGTLYIKKYAIGKDVNKISIEIKEEN